MNNYKTVIGLEIHAELNTKSKNFSEGTNSYSNNPNTNVNVVDLGMPGILPIVNKEAVNKSIKVALALNCTVPDYLIFDRKNYFYPDLPKGYQITQTKKPIGTNGYLMINIDGEDKKVLIHDTHLEEDTASLEHLSNYSLIDYNRCGVPLLETVTEPCLYSSKEAIAFLEAYRSLLQYTDVSEARSDRGQIRCDVNISLMKEGDTKLGTRTEMKNINSFSSVKLAIECEVNRQLEVLSNGGQIIQETRRYDEVENKTYPMREKVDAVDYKYYTEPNLPPYKIEKELVEEIRKQLPELQYARINKYLNNYNLERKDATTLVREKAMSDYFEQTIQLGGNPNTMSNILTGIVQGYLNKNNLSITNLLVTPKMLVDLLQQVEEKKISLKQAREVLTKSLEENKDPNLLIKELGITQIGNEKDIRIIVLEVINENLNLVEDYKKGKRVFDYFIGQVMKKSKGRANPSVTSTILKEELDKK